jgi:predicted  nucleic acid-binding Zn-ribbon protein
MFLESFRHLIEIVALKKQNDQNLQQIASENKRISDLEERRNKTTLRLNDIETEQKNLKLPEEIKTIEGLQQRLAKLTSQLALSVTEKEQKAFEGQILLVKEEKEKIEERYFIGLEKSEELTDETQDLESFLQGSAETLKNILLEVQKNIQDEEGIISNRKLRIESLLNLCQPSFKNMYLQTEMRFKNKSPVSFLIDKKCSECHMQADSMLKSSLEEGRSLEFCPSCGRLLIPETAKIY